jgi:flagellar biosynthesis protein FliQ
VQQKGAAAMQGRKGRGFILFCAMIVAINVAIIVAQNAFFSHNTAAIPKLIVVTVSSTIVAGLLLWGLRRWRYIKIAAISALLFFFGSCTIIFLFKGRFWGILIGAPACVWMSYEVIKEIARLKSHANSQMMIDSVNGKE